MLFLIWGQAVNPLWCPSLTKDMQTEQLLCWSGMTDTEHTTSGSNEEVILNLNQPAIKIYHKLGGLSPITIRFPVKLLNK